MSDFESNLARTPLRHASTEWRQEILRAARAAAAAKGTVPWWQRWQTPQPIALAAAWLMIAATWIATPADVTSAQPANLANLRARVQAQQQLIADLLDAPRPQSSPPVHHQGATTLRRWTQRA
jgi:hypothetical protein